MQIDCAKYNDLIFHKPSQTFLRRRFVCLVPRLDKNNVSTPVGFIREQCFNSNQQNKTRINLPPLVIEHELHVPTLPSAGHENSRTHDLHRPLQLLQLSLQNHHKPLPPQKHNLKLEFILPHPRFSLVKNPHKSIKWNVKSLSPASDQQLPMHIFLITLLPPLTIPPPTGNRIVHPQLSHQRRHIQPQRHQSHQGTHSHLSFRLNHPDYAQQASFNLLLT